jgi:uncharacterized protein YaiI (UPF0178 family)
MGIWVDADGCPAVIREILYRAANRAQIPLTLVANRVVQTPPSPWIRAIRVAGGFDVADSRIVDEVQPNDLVITADIPLAALVIERQGTALNPRGELYTRENIRERLALRNFMEELRSTGVATGGPPPLSNGDRQAFASQLDRYLANLQR